MAHIIEDIKDFGRLDQIIAVMMDVGLHDFANRLQLKGKKLFDWKVSRKVHALSSAEKLRLAFEKLGPTFIKFGQLLSVRPDLVPADFIKELSKLQDKVPEEDWEDIQQAVETELNAPIGRIFKSFSKNPINAGSIAQVHIAELKTGEKVAVKVQRPKIKEIIRRDIHLLYHLANLMEKHWHDAKIYNPVETVHEFEKWIEKELDFLIEARNAERMHQNFAGIKSVKIPKVYWKLSTRKVLTAEFLEGRKLKDLVNDSLPHRQQVLRNIVSASLKQVMEDGFFHADPHPGNILVLNRSTIGFVDFGIVGNLDDPLKEKLCGLMIGVNNRDLNKVFDAILELNISDGDINEAKLRNDIRENLDIWYVRSAKEYVAGDLIKLAKLAHEDNVKLPLDFVLLTKQILTLDGVGKILDPDFNYARELEPYVKKFLKDQLSFEKIKQKLKTKGEDLAVFLDRLPRHLLSVAQKLEKGKIKLEIEPKEIKEITHLTHELESASEKIALALLIGAIAVGAAILANVEKLPRIYGWPISNIIFVIAALMGLWLILSIIRGRG